MWKSRQARGEEGPNAARAQLGAKPEDILAFIREFVRSELADADELDRFDPDHFDYPDGGDIPESASVIGQFIRDCKVEGIHEPDRARWMVSLTDDSVAQLFDGATWLTAYSLS